MPEMALDYMTANPVPLLILSLCVAIMWESGKRVKRTSWTSYR